MRLTSVEQALVLTDIAPVPLWLGLGGVLAGGTVLCGVFVRRRRRTEAGVAAAEPVPHGDPRVPALLVSSVRELAGGLAEREQAIPDIGVFFASPTRIVAHLATPSAHTPPAPWRADQAGLRWTADATEIRQWERGPLPIPALVPVGAAHGWHVLVDLEQAPGLISVGGPAAEAMRVINALAFELATGGWTREVTIMMVGFAADVAVPDPGRIRQLASLADALDRAEDAARQASMTLGRLDVPNAATGRNQAAGLGVTVLLLAEPPPDDVLDRVTRLATDAHSCVVVLCAGDSQLARWRFEATADGRLLLDPLGLDVYPMVTAVEERQRQIVAAGRRGRVLPVPDLALPGWPGSSRNPPASEAPTVVFNRPARLEPDPMAAGPNAPSPGLVGPNPVLRTAAALAESAGGDPAHLTGRPPRPPASPGAAPAAVPATAPRPEIHLLGPVEVHAPGPVAEGDRALLTELAVAATDPDGLPDTLLRGLPGDVIERLGAWLGHDATGPRLLRHGDGWRLAPDVRVDWTRFRRLVASASAEQDPDPAMAALAMFRGELWSATGRFLDLTPSRNAVCASVIDAVRLAADLAVTAGERGMAEWAIQQGLVLLPNQPGMWRVLLEFVGEHGTGELAETVTWLRTRPGIERLLPTVEPGS